MKHSGKNNFWLRICSVLVDALVIFLSFKYADILSVQMGAVSSFDYRILFVLEAITIFFFFIFDLYASKEGSRENTAVSIILSSIISVVGTGLLSHIAFNKALPLKFSFSLFILLLFSLLVWRIAFSFGTVRFKAKKKVLILESVKVPSRLARKMKYSCNNVNEAWYYLVDDSLQEERENVINNVLPYYDIVYISQHLTEDFQNKLFEECVLADKAINFLALPSNISIMSGVTQQFSDTPVIALDGFGMEKYQRFFKRLFDIIFSLCVLICALPVFAIIALAIKLDSSGPVFYTQERYTRGKKIFKVYKFRTMFTDAEKNGEQLATENDPRITRVGSVIRKLRLDEIPQFINVLVGSMSVVGPRPERPVFADEFEEKVKYYNLRYTMKAGITGYAQVYGKYNTRVSDKILMDLIYALNYSFWLDIKLIVLTVRTMFIKGSTEGINEAMEEELNRPEKEIERRKNNDNFLKQGRK